MRERLGFNPLGFLAAIVIAVGLLFPFWNFRLEYMKPTEIYAYIIKGPITEYIGYNRSSQMGLLTGVLIACIIFCLAGSLLKGKAGRIFLAIAGILIFLCIWRFLVRMEGIADYFDLPIQGHGTASAGAFAKVEGWTAFQPGFYLIAAGGILAILASILHNRIQLRLTKGS
jgi:hypothetical protein